MPILSPDLGPTRGFTVVRIPLDVDTYDYTGKFTLSFSLLFDIILTTLFQLLGLTNGLVVFLRNIGRIDMVVLGIPSLSGFPE